MFFKGQLNLLRDLDTNISIRVKKMGRIQNDTKIYLKSKSETSPRETPRFLIQILHNHP